jgi:hypothetical protein
MNKKDINILPQGRPQKIPFIYRGQTQEALPQEHLKCKKYPLCGNHLLSSYWSKNNLSYQKIALFW